MYAFSWYLSSSTHKNRNAAAVPDISSSEVIKLQAQPFAPRRMYGTLFFSVFSSLSLSLNSCFSRHADEGFSILVECRAKKSCRSYVKCLYYGEFDLQKEAESVVCDICGSNNVKIHNWMIVGPCKYKFSEKEEWKFVPTTDKDGKETRDNVVAFNPMALGPIFQERQANTVPPKIYVISTLPPMSYTDPAHGLKPNSAPKQQNNVCISLFPLIPRHYLMSLFNDSSRLETSASIYLSIYLCTLFVFLYICDVVIMIITYFVYFVLLCFA
jgi:hypothetical protein